jgi:rhamnosyl/mannosyltransferase
MKAFLSRMQAIVCTSQAYINSSLQLLSYQQQLKVIPIGIDEARYPVANPERVKYWKDRLGDHFFLFIGAFRYYKGLDDLVNACAGTSLSVVLLGDGPEKAMIDRLISQLGLEGQIHCVGALDDDDKQAILHLARAVVLPSSSRAEAFGISLLEGLMAGKPLVSTELSTGTSWVNQHEQTGLVVSPQLPIALRQALLQLNEDDVLVERMGQAARVRYEEIFTATHMGRSYVNLYEAILKENRD